MNFIDSIKEKAKQSIKTIVLPESSDIRVIEAARVVTDEGFAKVVLIGNRDKLDTKGIDISDIDVIDPETSDKFEEYASAFYELRKAKGMTPEKAHETLKNNIYFGTMMVKQGDADGLVAGSICSTADTLRPALQILKTAPNVKPASSFFITSVPNSDFGENGMFLFGDCALNTNPTDDELSEIAISSAKSWRSLMGNEPRVAMLSYSTLGSAPLTDMTSKVINATNLLKDKAPDIKVVGEIQLDAAIVPKVAAQKAPDNDIAGSANVLIFPDLNAGNIGYKLVQRLANADAFGPITQGIARPVNDLSRGCSSKDIVGVVAFTALQAINSNL